MTMKYEIEIRETVERNITIGIEVEDEGDGIMLANILEDDIEDAIHPDDITSIFEKHGIPIISKHTSAEDVSYEIW